MSRAVPPGGSSRGAEALGYRAASATLRKKIALLEGFAYRDDDDIAEPALSAAELEAAAEAPVLSEKVFAAVLGWDDIALAGLLGAALGTPLQRVSVEGEDQMNDPRHIADDVIVVRCLTKAHESIIVLLKGALLLLPSTRAVTRICYNTLHRLTEQMWEGSGPSPNYQWSKCVALTFVKDHSSGTFASYEKGDPPWRHVVRWGPNTEPWNLCEFHFISLSDYERHGAPLNSPFGQWCWFLSRQQQHTSPETVPSQVMGNPEIRQMWRACSRVAPRADFHEEWGEAAAGAAQSAMICGAEHDARMHAQEEALAAHRIATSVAQHRAIASEWNGAGR